MAENYGFLPFFIENAVCDGYTSSTDFVGPPSPRSHPKNSFRVFGDPAGEGNSQFVALCYRHEIIFNRFLHGKGQAISLHGVNTNLKQIQ
ncbi:MAG: hypothetical protein J6Q89_03100 [Clostridia bacterium]|nr:hypothetical protein [Clostridia bacterium]